MAYHPQTEGQTEHINQCVEQYLQNFCLYQQHDWVNWIGLAEFQYNNLIHDTTHTIPFYANYHFHPAFSITPIQKTATPTASDFLTNLTTIHSEFQAELKKLPNDTMIPIGPKLHSHFGQSCHAFHEGTLKLLT